MKTIEKDQVSFKTPVMWEEKHRQALNVLTDCLTSPPVLAYPDFSQPSILHTDTSEGGSGYVFYQRGEGYRVRIPNVNQSTICIPEKLGFLALKWATTEQFRDYLFYASSFTVYTDNNPSNGTIKLGQRMHRLLNMGLRTEQN